MDTYVELLARKPKSTAASILLSLMGGIGVVFFFIGLMSTILITIPAALVIWFAYFKLTQGRLEYEYLYLDKELSIDRIKNQSKRKKVATYAVSAVEVMAPMGSHRLDSYHNLKVTDFSSERLEGNPYELVVEGANGRERIRIDTSDELIKAIKGVIPRKVFAD